MNNTTKSMCCIFLLVLVSACSHDIRKSSTASISTKPFNIKANDVLGIKLGMSLSDYKRQLKNSSDECGKEDAITEVQCMVVPNPLKDKLTVGGTDVSIYELTFYQHRLIDIEYNLVSIDWNPLEKSLEEKFGSATASDNNYWMWRNTVSSIRLDRSTNDRSSATLRIKLDKESDELLERWNQHRDAEAKHDL